MIRDPLGVPTTFRQSCALAWAQAHLAAFLSRHPDAKYDECFQEFRESYENGLYVADHLSQSLDSDDPAPREGLNADVRL